MRSPARAYDVLSLDAYGTIFEGGSDAFVALVRGWAAARGVDADALLRRREALIGRLNERPFVRIGERDRAIVRDLAERLPGPPLDVEDVLAELAREYATVRVYDDARRLLAAVEGRVRWGVASNCDADVMQRLLAEHGLRPDFVVTSESAGAYKPDRRLFEAVAQAAGAAPARILHAGDSWTADVEGAKAVGMGAAWVRRPDGLPRPERPRSEADLAVDDLTALASALGL